MGISLINGSTQKVIRANVTTLIKKANMRRTQAIAIANRKAGKTKKRKPASMDRKI